MKIEIPSCIFKLSFEMSGFFFIDWFTDFKIKIWVGGGQKKKKEKE